MAYSSILQTMKRWERLFILPLMYFPENGHFCTSLAILQIGLFHEWLYRAIHEYLLLNMADDDNRVAVLRDKKCLLHCQKQWDDLHKNICCLNAVSNPTCLFCAARNEWQLWLFLWYRECPGLFWSRTCLIHFVFTIPKKDKLYRWWTSYYLKPWILYRRESWPNARDGQDMNIREITALICFTWSHISSFSFLFLNVSFIWNTMVQCTWKLKTTL